MPLYPPTVLYMQALHEAKSRVIMDGFIETKYVAAIASLHCLASPRARMLHAKLLHLCCPSLPCDPTFLPACFLSMGHPLTQVWTPILWCSTAGRFQSLATVEGGLVDSAQVLEAAMSMPFRMQTDPDRPRSCMLLTAFNQQGGRERHTLRQQVHDEACNRREADQSVIDVQHLDLA